MSELTRCNYCTLCEIRIRAKKEGKKVEVKPASYEGNLKKFASQGGFDVFVNGKKTHWLMEISEGCVC